MSAAAKSASAKAGVLAVDAPIHLATEPAAGAPELQPEMAHEKFWFWFAQSHRDLGSLISGTVFLLVGGLMVGFQYFAPTLEPYAHEYILFRNVLATAAVILIAYSAAQDGIFRGLLCVFFPPYLFLYATGQEESPWLRGIFMGVLLGLCAEAFLLPEKSLILELGPTINSLIEQVENWMALASRPPV